MMTFADPRNSNNSSVLLELKLNESVYDNVYAARCTNLRTGFRFPMLLENFRSFKHSLYYSDIEDIGLDFRITYIDSDHDEIPIECELEFIEVLKIIRNCESKTLKLRVYPSSYSGNIESSPEVPKTRYPSTANCQSDLLAMPPINLNESGHDWEGSQPQSKTLYNVKESESLEGEIPKWFTNYMEKMKKEIITEVTGNVEKSMSEALRANHLSPEGEVTNNATRAPMELSQTQYMDKIEGLSKNITEDLMEVLETKHSRQTAEITKNVSKELSRIDMLLMEHSSKIAAITQKMTKTVTEALRSNSSSQHETAASNVSSNPKNITDTGLRTTPIGNNNANFEYSRSMDNFNRIQQFIGMERLSCSDADFCKKQLHTGQRPNSNEFNHVDSGYSHIMDTSKRTRKYIEMENYDSSSGSNEDRCKNQSHHRYRVSEKQKKKQGKAWQSNTTQTRRVNKFSELQSQSCESTCEYCGVSDENRTPKRGRDSKSLNQKDTTRKICDVLLESEDPADSVDVRIPKERTENILDVGTSMSDCLRERIDPTGMISDMGCSVTGNDMLDEPNARILDYFAFSDSDNVSIISDVSHSSEKRKAPVDKNDKKENSMRAKNLLSNVLEKMDGALNLIDESANNDDIDIEVVDQNESRDNDDHDSSSFELLSESPSPPPSIQIEEDHFSQENDTKNYNLDNEHTKKPFVIDTVGRIYPPGYFDFPVETPKTPFMDPRVNLKILNEKCRKVLRRDPKSETQFEDVLKASSLNETNLENTTLEENLNDESTQSFHSHTAPKTEKNYDNLEKYTTMSDNSLSSSSQRIIFVDENVSKGLGDTKQLSPNKQNEQNPRSDDTNGFDSEKTKASRSSENYRRTSFPWRHRSGRHSEFSRFNNPTTVRDSHIEDRVVTFADPMEILPESIVTGAIQIADGVYTVARRICDLVLTAREMQRQNRRPGKRN